MNLPGFHAGSTSLRETRGGSGVVFDPLRQRCQGFQRGQMSYFRRSTVPASGQEDRPSRHPQPCHHPAADVPSGTSLPWLVPPASPSPPVPGQHHRPPAHAATHGASGDNFNAAGVTRPSPAPRADAGCGSRGGRRRARRSGGVAGGVCPDAWAPRTQCRGRRRRSLRGEHLRAPRRLPTATRHRRLVRLDVFPGGGGLRRGAKLEGRRRPTGDPQRASRSSARPHRPNPPTSLSPTSSRSWRLWGIFWVRSQPKSSRRTRRCAMQRHATTPWGTRRRATT